MTHHYGGQATIERAYERAIREAERARFDEGPVDKTSAAFQVGEYVRIVKPGRANQGHFGVIADVDAPDEDGWEFVALDVHRNEIVIVRAADLELACEVSPGDYCLIPTGAKRRVESVTWDDWRHEPQVRTEDGGLYRASRVSWYRLPGELK